MPRSRRRPDVTTTGAQREAMRFIPTQAPQAQPLPPQPPIQGFRHDATTVARAFQALWLADEGTIRLTPSVDASCWHMTYKWRWGTWQDHYVYVKVSPDEFEWGLIMLYTKVREVWTGERRPTKDQNANYR